MSDGRFRILVVGIGGQGVLTASRLLGEAATRSGLGVVLGQLHGMSQRGGSVQSTVIIGPGRSSFIEQGQADVVLGVEPLEVLRARDKMSINTNVVVNLGQVVPHTLGLKGESYPEMDRLLDDIRAVAPQLTEVDGPAILEAVGVPRTLNIAMLGALAGLRILPYDDAMLWKAVEEYWPAHFCEPNRRAFSLGKEATAS